ncbi:uncharacterized protein ACA1_140520 [Acanthamoeba castellanii str. Neff]|uniref:LRAT domain-containing protein n=1 Tax=Acanthamoeba castellanii (strain ATCC 30010 / Neff) TaxID=1257118 RepID=L8GJ11_ACACF|nr:uncharacterized protein ACA1_140520 [Acanthamoeba castellanii str. Neff]ELR12146.1 hypothetical protein ACA1_140520 [Acanthamoeba castellanii str. Neff]
MSASSSWSSALQVGDVLWVKRSPLGEHHLYHHAGVVTRIDAHGRPTEVVDFGPGGEGEDIPLCLALTTGFEAAPRAGQEEEVLQRVAASLGVPRLYHLQRSNCQHYATEMSCGQASSAEALLLAETFRDIGSRQVVEVELFKGEGWLPVLANGLLTLLASAHNEAQHRYQLFTTLRTTHLSETNPQK